ncbi:MAG: SDR family NAD(P)-dependent oxidoreductase, partial [Mesorhizobium sp.]
MRRPAFRPIRRSATEHPNFCSMFSASVASTPAARLAWPACRPMFRSKPTPSCMSADARPKHALRPDPRLRSRTRRRLGLISTNLVGRRALVLGGGKGLGFGVAEALAAKGAEVILVGRGEETLDAARHAIEAAGHICSTFSADFSDHDSVSRLIHAVEGEDQRIDIVLLNGGGPPPFAASVFDASVWEKQFTSMVLSQMRIAVSFLPGMRARRWGRIITVSSTS